MTTDHYGCRHPVIDFNLASGQNFDILKLIPAVDSWINTLLSDCLCDMMLDPDRLEVGL